MTTNQIAYWANQETARSNLARETETNRSNIAKETETHRSNVVNETETHRSNLAKESLTKEANSIKATEVAFKGAESVTKSISNLSKAALPFLAM